MPISASSPQKIQKVVQHTIFIINPLPFGNA